MEGRSPLWTGIPNDRKETIRGKSFCAKVYNCVSNFQAFRCTGFLVYFESELLKRAHKNFDFRNGRSVEFNNFFLLVAYNLCSIGNYFLAAAQGFFRSLPSAIFLFSSITNSQVHLFHLSSDCHANLRQT